MTDLFAAFPRWRVVDDSGAAPEVDPKWHFAVDAALARSVGEGQLPTLRLWRHPGALVIGPSEGRLPGVAAAVGEAGVPALVRPSGGALVPLDGGVLNLSLAYPTESRTIDVGYRAMFALIGAALAPLGARPEKGEIAGSFCPGEYDLAVGGRKFCGIAQRRTRLGTVVGAFLLVEGTGAERARRAEAFYRTAGGDLQVREEALVALAEVLEGPVTVRLVAQAVAGALAQLSGEAVISPLTAEEELWADDGLEELMQRQPEGLK